MKIKYQSVHDMKYRVLETFTMDTGITLEKPIKTRFSYIDEAGNLTIEKGFCWDGASGAFDTDTIMRASLIHDCFCNWMAQDLIPYDPYWRLANQLFFRICKQDDMNDIRAKFAYLAVKANGRLRYGVE